MTEGDKIHFSGIFWLISGISRGNGLDSYCICVVGLVELYPEQLFLGVKKVKFTQQLTEISQISSCIVSFQNTLHSIFTEHKAAFFLREHSNSDILSLSKIMSVDTFGKFMII